MKVLVLLAYTAMAAWLLVAAGIRIALQLSSGFPLDPLPFISGGLGLIALLMLAPAADEFRERRVAPNA